MASLFGADGAGRLSGANPAHPPPTYIVVLVEQPVHALSQSVGAPYRMRLADLQERSRALVSAGDPASRRRLADLNAAAERTLHTMRRSILDAAAAGLADSQAPLVQAVSAAGGELLYRYRVVNALAVRLPESAVVELKARPDVAAIYRDQQITAQLDVSAAAVYAESWWNAGETGGIWDVAVIDSGLDSFHPAFAGHTILEGRFLDAAGNPTTDPSPDDVNGHGTHVAGIVSSGDAFYRGIAFGHDKLFNLKAAYDEDGADGDRALMYWSDAMAAVDWAFAQSDSPDVFNLSFGGCAAHPESGFTRFWDAVVDDLDVAVAISAGNDGVDCIHDPSTAYNVLSVANVDDGGTSYRSDDLISPTSSQGPAPDGRRKPDLAAPGTSILSANNTWDEGDGWWAGYSGTSQAAPHVAGALLLVLDGGLYSPIAQKALLINSADDRGSAGWDSSWGWGYLNLEEAYDRRTDVQEAILYPAPDHDLYLATLAPEERATLVWNRHVDYGGPVYPPSGDTHDLSDLDLYLYDMDTNAQVDASVLPGDNVEQVEADARLTGVLRVQAASASFDGVYFERYALAAGTGFAAADGPDLTTIPERAFYGIAGRTIRVTIPAINSGDLTLHAVSATTSVPISVTLLEGANPAALGNIPAGESRSASWVFQISDGMTHTLSIGLAGTGYGLAYAAETSAHLIEFVPTSWAHLPLVMR